MHNKRFMLYLLGIFISTIMLIVFLQYNSNDHINKLIQGNESLINEFQIIGETQKLQTDMLYIESEIHRAVIGDDSSYLEGILGKEKNAREGLYKLKTLVLTDSTKMLVQQLDSLIEEKLKFGNNILNALFMKGQPAAEEMYKSRKGKNAMGEIVSVINLLNGPRRIYLTQLAIDADKSGHRAREWGIRLAVTAVLACILTFLYITKRVKHQQQLFDQLNKSEKKVREVSRIKENFMANMSHEIRTPMNAILGFTHLLQKQPLNEKSREFVNSIQHSGESLLTIINDVLDFSKIEAGMMRIESNDFSLRGLLHSVETMFTARLNAKDLRLTVAIDQTVPDILNGDAVRLTQIMVNLVNNAIKFTHTGSIDIHVTAQKIREDKQEVSFSIKDTGIGIPAGKIETIFDRFQQADEDTTRKYGGTGLGLSIVKQLVELQNGSISVRSIQHTGTEFIFSIPYAIAQNIQEKRRLEYMTGDKIEVNRKEVKILVAEDNAMNQSLMKYLLADWSFDFEIVNNGKEAVETLRQKKYSLVLMDLQMPAMDGYTATSIIRNELKNTIPIVAMTAHAMAGEREKCLGYGMNEYISKPIREKELFKIIDDLLKGAGHTAGIKTESDHSLLPTAEVLDLHYLKELSHGNTVFEVDMIEQFLQQVPAELAEMENEFTQKNYASLAQIAHNMKTSLSFMGLTEKLGHHLEFIEKNAGIQKENGSIEEKIISVKKICRQAFEEAKKYLAQ